MRYLAHDNINYIEGENLNIYDATVKIIKKCWHDKSRFKSVAEITLKTGMSERAILKLAHDNNFKKRGEIRKYDVAIDSSNTRGLQRRS